MPSQTILTCLLYTSGRSGKSGSVSLFAGLLRCMDCGASMRYMRDYRKKTSGKEPEYKAYVCNRYASGGKDACSSHYINQKALAHVVLLDIRSKSMWAQFGRAEIREKLLAQKESAGREKTKTLQAELSAIDRRLPELDRLVPVSYTHLPGHPLPHIQREFFLCHGTS